MINANELRRGNWVKWDNADMFYQIESINENTGSEEDPILLTPEILEKAGFVFNEKNGYFERFHIDKDTRMNLKYRELKGGYSMVNYILKSLICTDIYFVHQLQNLYFALTGKELPIEL